MKEEYDFSAAARGKFYRPDTQLIPPVHLDTEAHPHSNSCRGAATDN
jgi:hypothetical protein